MMSEDADEMAVRIEDLQLVEIQELLEEQGLALSDDEAAQLAQFVAQVGGLEEALAVLAQMQQIKDAA